MRQPRGSWEIGWARPGDCRRPGAIVLRSWRREPLLLSQGTHCRALLDERREVRRRSEGLNGVVVTLRGEVSEPVSGGRARYGAGYVPRLRPVFSGGWGGRPVEDALPESSSSPLIYCGCYTSRREFAPR